METYKTEKNRAAPLLWKPAVAFGVLNEIMISIKHGCMNDNRRRYGTYPK
jgi:hypothetical protein